MVKYKAIRMNEKSIYDLNEHIKEQRLFQIFFFDSKAAPFCYSIYKDCYWLREDFPNYREEKIGNTYGS